MPRSHVCQGCGEDLAALRPEPEPHYGLRVVSCPVCGRRSVRSREPLIAGWRRLRVAAGATVMLGLHAAVLAGTTAVFTAVMMVLERPVGVPLASAEFRAAVVTAVVVPLLAGVWLGVTMPHRSRLARAGVWLGCQAVLPAFFAGIVLSFLAARPWFSVDRELAEIRGLGLGRWAAAVLASAVLVVLAEPGVLAGRFVWRFAVMSLFRWRRGRARLRRSGQ